MAKLTLDDALKVIETVIERTIKAGYPPPPYVVLLGGTALAAHGVRAESYDVDFFAPDVYQDILIQVENDLRGNFDVKFRIDGTNAESVWGDIVFRDLEESHQLRTLQVMEHQIPIRIIGLEDIYITKIGAFREKDLPDIVDISKEVPLAQLLGRFSQVLPWHGNRAALMGFIDHFVNETSRIYGMPRKAVISGLDIPQIFKDMLEEAGPEADP